MLYYLEKAGKIAAALGVRPQTPVSLRRMGAPPPDPQIVIPTLFYVLF